MSLGLYNIISRLCAFLFNHCSITSLSVTDLMSGDKKVRLQTSCQLHKNKRGRNRYGVWSLILLSYRSFRMKWYPPISFFIELLSSRYCSLSLEANISWKSEKTLIKLLESQLEMNTDRGSSCSHGVESPVSFSMKDILSTETHTMFH